ncbi:hypothetical protein EDB92DRAFT_1797968 [Lactarius akahatsu]|uniref:RING-type E3 ubiquitin transferase n=1 Tax=Lactarius akahatsu TaxID=416441 RepID=A0AAD4LHK4_9AGAM|nr:hypothetical protein EDB92DRAFT_1797968 [Lactarius akahatsu]
MTDGAPNTGLENNTIPRPASETDADQDTCRICSAPGEPDQPLFHPCKCSGTIRYIHQDCLTTWLSHSKKKTCDVCKYPYSFTKVYADNMPGQLPVVLLLRKFAQQVAFAIIFCIRAVIVSFVWLAVLPWVTVWTWRMYFAMGNSTAWWISARPRSPSSSSSSFFSYNLTIRSQANATATNATLSLSANDSDVPSLNALFAHPLLRTVSADIFTGQIIATLIVLVFIAVFLLREWISQNARPGVFEEDLPSRPPSRRAQEPRSIQRPQTVQLDQVTSLSSAAGPSSPVIEGSKDPTYVQARQERLLAAEKRQLFSIANDPFGETQGPGSQADDTCQSSRVGVLDNDPFVGGKGKAKATDSEGAIHQVISTSSTSNPSIILAALRQKRVDWGIPGAESWTLYDFERFEMTRFNIDLIQPSLLLRSVDSTPPASPNLATYQPPEEFQEGSVRGGYFDDFEKVNEDVGRDSEEVDPRQFERDMAQFFKEEPLAAQPPDKKIGPDAEEEEEEGDLPGLLVDSDEDGEEDAREPQAAAQHGEGVVAEADEDGEDAEGEDADDAALAAQLADEDIAVEDDMEGALEAIGMRGPLYVVAQNAALMIFVLDTAVGLGVWLPFTFGKSTALLSLDARRALQVLHWPIRVIRIVTDPVVDTIFFLMSVLVLPSITRLLGGSLNTVQWALSGIVPSNALEKSTHFAITMVCMPWGVSTSSVIDRILDSNHPAVKAAEHYLEVLGKQVRISSYQVATSWTRMALGDGTGERIFAIVLGYAVIGLLIAFYLNVFTVGTVRSAGRAVRSAVRQQLLVVKVAAFIIIELVLFPLGCGINLDLCSIWLFPEASLQSRIAFFQYAPLTATFYHWVVGTMFMYQFAILLASCRTIMRPGAMWFIKDPSDQNFHPIRDILERPALVQLRKLSVSAIMYGLVVACGVGSIGGLMRLGRGIILPLRWKPREPLSDVPIDLLFLHVLLPYTLRFFRPRRVVRKTSVKIWKYLCAQLRLTSYMFGGRHPDEERGVSYSSWWAPRNSGDEVAEGGLHFHGSYRRVPNSDNVAVPRDMRATARVDVTGLPVDDEAQRLITAQDAEAEKAKRNPKDDYTVVYIPPHFQYRVALFIFALWVVGCVFITATVSMPILLGRGVFNLFTRRQMHDGYSFLVGSYALWGCWVVGHTLDRMEKRRQRRGADEARGNWPLYFLKRSVLWLAKISYIVFFIGIVIPALIGLVVELYMIMPIRLSLNPDLVPNIRVADMWALGIIYAKIILHAQRLRPLNRITAGFNHIKAHGWTNPEPLSATVEFIVPLLVGLSGMLALPPVIVVLLRHLIPLRVDQRFIFMHVYPGIFAAVGLIRLGVTGSRALSRWSQSIRDTEFLVEMRLRNYEQEKEEEKIEEKEKGEPMLM